MAIRKVCARVDQIGWPAIYEIGPSLSSEEQGRGIEQIGRAIQKMEAGTQKSAANAEESAAAAEELNAQSAQLMHVATSLGEIAALRHNCFSIHKTFLFQRGTRASGIEDRKVWDGAVSISASCLRQFVIGGGHRV